MSVTNAVACVLAAQGTPQHAEEQFLSKVFLYVALAFVFWLMIAWRHRFVHSCKKCCSEPRLRSLQCSNFRHWPHKKINKRVFSKNTKHTPHPSPTCHRYLYSWLVIVNRAITPKRFVVLQCIKIGFYVSTARYIFSAQIVQGFYSPNF